MKIIRILVLLIAAILVIKIGSRHTASSIKALGVKVYELINSSIDKANLSRTGKVFQDASVIDKNEKNFESAEFLDKLYKKGEVSYEKFKHILSILNDVLKNEKINASCFVGPLKTKDRVTEKLEEIRQQYKNQVGYTAVTDIVRGSCVAVSAEDIPKMIHAAEKAFGKFERFNNRFNGDESGYRDCNTLVKVEDHICELQFHLQAILDYKNGEGHIIYEKTRVPGLSDEQKKALKMKSKDSYESAYKKAGGIKKFK